MPKNANPSSASQASPTDQAPIARRSHTKSRSGCRACKDRKVKCDENKPLCNNCRTHFIGVQACDYTPTIIQPRSKRRSQTAAASRPRIDASGQQRELSTRSPSSILSSIAPEMLDPFNTHPSSAEPDINILMSHYFKTCVFNMFPYYPVPGINPVTEFYASLIWTDTVLFNVTLQLSSFHMEKIQSQSRCPPPTRLMAECLRLLQARVNEPPERAVSDETIAAVAGLAALEHERGNMRMMQVHMSGLRKMLDIRGGLNAIRRENLTSGPTIANIVFCMFVAAVDEPFPSIDILNPMDPPAWYYAALAKFDHDEYLDFEACGVEREYATLMMNIRLLAKHYQTAADCATAEEYQSVLTFLTSTLQRLLSLPLPTGEEPCDSNITEACRHALIVHVFAQWCGHQPDPALMVSIARHSLQLSLRIILATGSRNPLLLWLLAVGGVGALGSPCRKWFVGHMAAFVADVGIQTWEQCRDCLKRIIWHDFQDEGTHRRLWEEVAVQLESSPGLEY